MPGNRPPLGIVAPVLLQELFRIACVAPIALMSSNVGLMEEGKGGKEERSGRRGAGGRGNLKVFVTPSPELLFLLTLKNAHPNP